MKPRSPIDRLIDQSGLKCTICGKPPGCSCWEVCKCGWSFERGTECSNKIWHIALQLAEEAADLIVADMAESYKLFQRDHMAARLKRAVVRQTHQFFIDVFDGVEDAKREIAIDESKT